ncbi:MAG: hypothetical protein LBF34_02305 [Puniceicoccales bacterium]|jgi:hypothetical protein|nr:hypothetical protein [Puniceicoccales bacterium]
MKKILTILSVLPFSATVYGSNSSSIPPSAPDDGSVRIRRTMATELDIPPAGFDFSAFSATGFLPSNSPSNLASTSRDLSEAFGAADAVLDHERCGEYGQGSDSSSIPPSAPDGSMRIRRTTAMKLATPPAGFDFSDFSADDLLDFPVDSSSNFATMPGNFSEMFGPDDAFGAHKAHGEYGQFFDVGTRGDPLRASVAPPEGAYDDDFQAAVLASLADRKEISQGNLRLIQQHLPEGRIVFDMPSNGLCGDYSLQVLSQVLTSPQEILRVSISDVRAGMKRMSELILRQATEFEQRSSSDGGTEEDSPIAILRTTLLEDRRYRRYVKAPNEFNWPLFCRDLKAGKIWFDYPFFLFAREAWGLPQIECVDGTNLQTLREIPRDGALIGIGGNHFVVALPRILKNGVEVKEVICEDWDGQQWRSVIGEPASIIPSERFMPVADAFPLPQPAREAFVVESLDEIARIQRSLHKDMVLFDLPELEGSYYAFLAIRFVRQFPEQSTVMISRSMVNAFLGGLANLINKTCSDIPKIARDKFLNDLRNGDLPISTELLPFALETLGLPREIAIISSDDVAQLGKFHSYGVLIQCQSGRFVVALPKRTDCWVEIAEIICEDWDGRFFRSMPGRLASEVPAVSCRMEWPPNMILLDVPGFGKSGYFALLAIRFVMDNPHESKIIISKEQLSLYCVGIADQIKHDLENQSQNLKVCEEIEMLQAVLLDEARYCDDQGEVVWKGYLDNMRNGRVEMNDAVLPFACRALNLNLDAILRSDDENFLRNIPPTGAPIYCPPLSYYGLPVRYREFNHFMVILPRNGKERVELMCQEQDGEWWHSDSGMLVRYK